MDKYISDNLKLWNKRVDVHFDSRFYDVEAFLAGKSSLNSIELGSMGDISGLKILHLQCHFGLDSLSLVRAGAEEVVGVDFSDKAVEKANYLSRETGLNARFIQSDVLKLDQVLEEKFDMIFTSYGVLGWLPDLASWSRIVDHFLKPGGIFYIVEFHPVLYMLDEQSGAIKYDYFHQVEPSTEEESVTYTGGDLYEPMTSHFWSYSLSEVLHEFIKRDYKIELFKEHPYSPYNCFPKMKEVDVGKYQLGTIEPSFPHLFELKCRKKR